MTYFEERLKALGGRPIKERKARTKERKRTARRASERRRTAEHVAATTLLTNIKKRARLRGLPCDLTLEDVRAMLVHCRGRCELTGIELDYGAGHHKRRPWFPSIDRVHSAYGYLPGNVRIVCVAVNIAMNEWGEEILRRIAEALAPRKRSGARWRRKFSHFSPTQFAAESAPAPTT